MEHWEGSGGTTGTSMNYYHGGEKKWIQDWVNAGGNIINYSGGLENGVMILTGNIYDVQIQGKQTRNFRGTWTPLHNGVVRQLFEESKDGGETWIVGFDGYYFPIKE
jgi:hypothetical protein